MAILKTLGKIPSGEELEKIKYSPNYEKGVFQNLSPTEMMMPGTSYLEVMWDFINKPADCFPQKRLPSIKTDLLDLQNINPVIVWFGHSSYFIRINEKNILVDPVLNGHASPFSFTTKSFPGTDVYTTDDFPPIDILLLTHDHYDHLAYETVVALKDKAALVCTSLGVASHLLYWGFDKNKVIEFDWWDSRKLPGDITLTAAPARHFSGRTFKRNKTLWSSFILQTPHHSLYLGGDSGYDTHFSAIGKKFGPFDIALLECGQYNTAWPLIHMMPEQTAQASVDLQARVLMPVHWGKFSLSLHPWDEPVKRVVAKAKELGVQITTPLIGQPVVLDESYPAMHWWEEGVEITRLMAEPVNG